MESLESYLERVKQVKQRCGFIAPPNKSKRANVSKTFKTSVLARDEYQCQTCGSVDRDKLTVHHVKPISTHPDLKNTVSNGITLCIECHNDEHRKKKGKK